MPDDRRFNPAVMFGLKTPGHLIDCDAYPYTPPYDWYAVENRRGGIFKWDPRAVELFFSEPQHKEKFIKGKKLRRELENKLVLNANVLDYLLANPHLIPEEWKKDEKGRPRCILFWGTIYTGDRGSWDDGLYVRCLSWTGDRWESDYHHLGEALGILNPAALRAS